MCRAWQNRFFSAPLDRDHLHTALRYVDLNPVRAGLVEQAVEYRWSSASAHVNGRDEWSLLDPKNWRKVSTRNDWADALRDPVMEADEMARLQKATRTGRPLGSADFVTELEGEVTALRASGSWRVTRPLRWLAARLLRGN